MRRLTRWLVIPAVAVVAWGFGASPALAEDPLNGEEWWFTSWKIQDVWETTKGDGQVVAVIDSGVDASLGDLDGVVLPGLDLIGQTDDGRQDTDTEEKHGSRMATLIAGTGTGDGMVGIAPDARILPVVDGHTLPAGENEHINNVARAIKQSTDAGSTVINMSFGFDSADYPDLCPPEVLDAVRYAVDRDVVLVASAGNEGDTTNKPIYPASCPGVLAVGAVDKHNQPWESTQRQDYVDVAAPGVDIVGFLNGQIGNSDGTSDASALASGAVALLRSAFPDEDGRQTVARILNSLSNPVPDGSDLARGYGTISMVNAMTASLPDDARNPVYDELDAIAPPVDDDAGTGGAPAGNSASGNDSDGVPVGVIASVSGGGAAIIVILVVALVMTRRRHRPLPYPVPGGHPPQPRYGPPNGPSWPPPPDRHPPPR